MSEVWYDELKRTTKTVDAEGATVRYDYDASSNIVAITDALGNVTRYEYDALGHTVSYTYTPEGWLETVTDGTGHVTRYTYDRTGNILTADYAGEQTETNTYNELGLLTTVTTAEGDTLYQYDQASRLISVTQPSGETVSYTYDSRGNRSSMTYPNGRTVTYTYDDMNRLIAVKGIDGETTKYEYDALGRRIATDGAKEDTVYTYDEVGNLVSQTTTGSYDLALAYAYDLSGRMTQESRTENGATLESVFTYDPLGQLTDFTRSDGISESYTYDAVGNMTVKTVNGVKTRMGYNAANQLTRSVTNGETTRYTYDANGNLVRSENAGGVGRYAYNALNLLESFTREDGYTESYRYNANRLLSEIRTSEGLTTALTWDILYGDGVVIGAAQNGKSTSFTYGLERISAITGSTRTEYVYDGRGSVAAELSYNTAWYTVGGLIARKHVTSKSYTPFGEQIGEAVSGYGYNGEYYNAATGMIYLRARFYEPELNRFSQKDILRGSVIQPGSLNRYLYCQNDPVNYSDPSGMRQVAGIYGDGTGRTSTAKQTTPIVTKPSQSKVSSAAAASRTVAVPVTDTGTGGNSATKKSSVINNVAASISSAASAATTVVKATVNSVFTSNTSPNSNSLIPTSAGPTVVDVEPSNCGGVGILNSGPVRWLIDAFNGISSFSSGKNTAVGRNISEKGITLFSIFEYIASGDTSRANQLLYNLEQNVSASRNASSNSIWYSAGMIVGDLELTALELALLILSGGTSATAETPALIGAGNDIMVVAGEASAIGIAVEGSLGLAAIWNSSNLGSDINSLINQIKQINLQSPSHMLGENGTQYESHTSRLRNGGRIDSENPNPGKRPGQIHYQDGKGGEWWYNPETGSFYNDPQMTELAPSRIQKLLEDQEVIDAIAKELRFLGEIK